jgi:phosphoribosylaminoimidazolecarboxamide formyltransferase/IMP cyclohydrolase
MASDRVTVKRAFVSVSDRTGLVVFARFLAEKGVQLYATGGTASFLTEGGIPVTPAQELTGVVEMLSGKVKSLSPRLHAAILFDRSKPEEAAHIEAAGVLSIDMVVVNFYAFQNVGKEVPPAEAVALIDIGGPAAVRAAAKNFAWVVPVPDPGLYEAVMDDVAEGEKAGGATSKAGCGVSVSRELSARLAARVFDITSSYDRLIADYLAERSAQPAGATAGTPESQEQFPETLMLTFTRAQTLRYGENPHQRASFYVSPDEKRTGTALGRQLQGKGLSFNNLLDVDAAVSSCREFEEPACVVIKHRNPAGVSVSRDILTAYRHARDCDTLSAFGGVVAVNRTVTQELAAEMTDLFLEVVAAPGFDAGAVEAFSKKKNLRLLELPDDYFSKRRTPRLVLRSGLVGLLAEEDDWRPENPTDWKVVSRRVPTQPELAGLLFLWRVVRHTISNAIVIGGSGPGGDGYRTVGIGAGQTSRVDAVETALYKAKRSSHEVQGSWLASDAFFPFRDSIDVAANAGVEAIVEPGGSVRDAECIRAADEHGALLCFTGRRCFKH